MCADVQRAEVVATELNPIERAWAKTRAPFDGTLIIYLLLIYGQIGINTPTRNKHPGRPPASQPPSTASSASSARNPLRFQGYICLSMAGELS